MRPPGLSSKTESCSGETGKFTSGYMLGWRYQPDLPMGCLLEHWSYWTELEKNCGIYQHIIVMKAMKIDEKANRTECLNQGHLHMTFFFGGGGGRGLAGVTNLRKIAFKIWFVYFSLGEGP